ncbi:hypothetical protein IV417_15750 [Alphaproteobacteria bacterium KMM 3653]|uniref:Uncharacterized protein n=1 Tax=Harenicola maris TaxID=2841044 RepID=A0AAP2G5E0_9RHOB|nr:hypothetical protein [Harenicola maris]
MKQALRAAAFGLVAGMPLGAQAQIGMSQGLCAESVSKIAGALRPQSPGLAGAFAGRVGEVKLAAGGWCVLQRVEAETDAGHLSIGTLKWKAGGFDRVLYENLPPERADLALEDARLTASGGRSLSQRLSGGKAVEVSFDASVSYRWTSWNKQAEVKLAVTTEAGEEVTLSAQVGGVDLDAPGTLEGRGAAWRIRKADALVQGRGNIGPLMIAALMADGQSRDEAEERLEDTGFWISAAARIMPSAMLDSRSSAALISALSGWPNMRGVTKLRLDSAKGIGPAEVRLLEGAGPKLSSLSEVLEGLKLTVSHAP